MVEIELLKKQIAEEVKEKYVLYKKIKELNEQVNELTEELIRIKYHKKK